MRTGNASLPSTFCRRRVHVYPDGRTTHSRTGAHQRRSHKQSSLHKPCVYDSGPSASASAAPSDMLRPLLARSEREPAAPILRSDNVHTSSVVLHTTVQPLSTLRGWSMYASNRFINRYGETDNYLCQMLRRLVHLSDCIFYL